VAATVAGKESVMTTLETAAKPGLE
jgi:hypothetical protein